MLACFFEAERWRFTLKTINCSVSIFIDENLGEDFGFGERLVFVSGSLALDTKRRELMLLSEVVRAVGS